MGPAHVEEHGMDSGTPGLVLVGGPVAVQHFVSLRPKLRPSSTVDTILTVFPVWFALFFGLLLLAAPATSPLRHPIRCDPLQRPPCEVCGWSFFNRPSWFINALCEFKKLLR